MVETDTTPVASDIEKPTPPEWPHIAVDATDDERDAALAEYQKACDEYDAALVKWAQNQPVLSIDQIRNSDDLNEGPTWVEEWKGCVVTRGLSRREYNECKAEAERLAGNRDSVEYLEQLGRLALFTGMVEPKIADDEPMWERHPHALKTVADAVLEKSGVMGELAAIAARNFPGD